MPFEELWPDSSNSDTLVVNHLDLDYNFEGHDDKEDLMYGTNNYGEAPVPEQLKGTMNVDNSDSELENN